MYWTWIFIALASVWFHHRPLAVSRLFPVSHSSVNDVKRLACESYPTCGMLPNNYQVASCSILRLIFNSVVQHLSGRYPEYITIYMLAAGGIIRKNCLCFRSYPDDNLCPRYYSRFWSLNQQGDKNEFSTNFPQPLAYQMHAIWRPLLCSYFKGSSSSWSLLSLFIFYWALMEALSSSTVGIKQFELFSL